MITESQKESFTCANCIFFGADKGSVTGVCQNPVTLTRTNLRHGLGTICNNFERRDIALIVECFYCEDLKITEESEPAWICTKYQRHIEWEDDDIPNWCDLKG